MTATEHPISMAVKFPTSNPDSEVAAHVELGASLDDVVAPDAECKPCPVFARVRSAPGWHDRQLVRLERRAPVRQAHRQADELRAQDAGGRGTRAGGRTIMAPPTPTASGPRA